jgi:hypothetical protein
MAPTGASAGQQLQTRALRRLERRRPRLDTRPNRDIYPSTTALRVGEVGNAMSAHAVSNRTPWEALPESEDEPGLPEDPQAARRTPQAATATAASQAERIARIDETLYRPRHNQQVNNRHGREGARESRPDASRNLR